MGKLDPKAEPPPRTAKVPTREEAKQAIQILLRKAYRPVPIGAASLHLGGFWNLARTEELFMELIHEGLIRHITPEECRKFDLHEAFVLI